MKSSKILGSKKVQLLLLMSLVLTLTLGVYIYSGKPITYNVDGNATDAVSYSKTVGEFLDKEEVNIQEGAYINLPLDTQIEDNLNIIIVNPKTYNIKDNKDIQEVKSVHDLAGRVLSEKEIELNELDYTTPQLGAKIEEGSTIEIFRVKEEVVVAKSDILYERKIEYTDSLYKGEEKLKQEGSSGELSTSTKERYVNDELEKSEVIKEEVTIEKKDHIILVGTKDKPVPKPVVKVEPKAESANRNGSRKTKAAAEKTPAAQAPVAKAPAKQTEVSKAPAKQPEASKAPAKQPEASKAPSGRTITMEATAYTDDASSQGKWVGQTASGMKPQYGVVAVDPRVIPLGTKLYIEGYGNAIAGDTGGAIKGNRIDLFFNTKSEVYNFGRRNVKVTILD